MTSIVQEEIVEIDLEDVQSLEPSGAKSEDQQEKVGEESGDEVTNPQVTAAAYSVQEPVEEEGDNTAVHINHTVQLESVDPEDLPEGETDTAVVPDEVPEGGLDYSHDSALSEQEIEDALEANTSELERLEGEDLNDDYDESGEEGIDASVWQTPIIITPPAYTGSPVPLYGLSGIIEDLPQRDTSLDQVFDVVRGYFEYLPADKELFFSMPQLDLQLGEDNIYCNDTTVVDLLRLLGTCEEEPSTLEINLQLHDRFISKLNALFDVLNDMPPTKRRRLDPGEVETGAAQLPMETDAVGAGVDTEEVENEAPELHAQAASLGGELVGADAGAMDAEKSDSAGPDAHCGDVGDIGPLE